jgi:hypothetical protein
VRVSRRTPGWRFPLGLATVLVAAACGSPATSTTDTAPTATAGPTAVAPSTTGAPSPAPSSTTPPATAAATTTSAPGGDGPAAGPGALATYTVQPQPAPGSCHYRWVGTAPLPDPRCTPGATNPAVTPATLAATVCARGWTATVRPPTGVTTPEKVASAAAYAYRGPWSSAEYDHLVPLELGGDPNDPANLWLEPNDRVGATSFANGKDLVENHLHALVCAGTVPLAEAQRAIAADWVAAGQRYGT